MIDSLARARRFFGRVLDTVRGGEPIVELVPDAPPAPMARVASSSSASSVALVRRLEIVPEPNDDRVPEAPSARSLADDPARALLAEVGWSGLRHETRAGDTLLAWRDLGDRAEVLRTIEIRCAYGALDAAPEVAVVDRPIASLNGAVTLASDAARWMVALGSIRDGAFVSVAHANLR